MADDPEIDLNLLLALGALLEDRNLTRAGERIGMSQPAMSAALARLRRHYGDDLLEREGRGYRRTMFGEQLLPTVREALRQLEATTQRSPRFDPAESDREFSIAASDYAVSILADPLLRLVKQAAPRIRLHLHSLPPGLTSSPLQALAMYDLLIGPVGFDFPGRHTELFRDRLVCVVDPVASGLTGPALSLADLVRLPHAEPSFAPGQPTPVDRLLDERGIRRQVRVTVFGWLSVPFVLVGTEMVAIMPQRLARLAIRSAPLAILEPPFGLVELVEAAYWHPSRTDDPAVRWLLKTLKEAARGLLIRGFGVQVPGGALVLTWGFIAPGHFYMPDLSRFFCPCSLPACSGVGCWRPVVGPIGLDQS
jgi:DNA-binding transcriptional LysR family regulator